jgi:hypothetical protein
MATIAVTLDTLCTGNTHAHVDLNVDSGALLIGDVLINRNSVMTPITAEEVPDLLTSMLRVKFRGMTAVQVRNALQAGFTMTL